MPLKKLEWGDIPNENYVKNKDVLGKWIECVICDVKMSVRSQYCFTEWDTHCSGVRHSKIVSSKAIHNVKKIDSFFKKRSLTETNSSVNSAIKKQPSPKRPKINTCPGFYYGKNTDLLPLYDKYKRKDSVNDSINIIRNHGQWSIHSINCMGEQVNNRKSLRPDKKACEYCFKFDSIEKVRDRIRRISRISTVENFLMETKSSNTGFWDITKYLKSNVTDVSENVLKLRHRCTQYISHHLWIKKNWRKLQEYDAVDENGKVCHDKWISQLNNLYHNEPAMKDSLLNALIQFTLSRYNGHVNAQCSPKLIAFFQNIYALNPKFYRVFSQNFGGYNERTLRRYEAEQSPEEPIVDCSEKMIKKRANEWIMKLRMNNQDGIILVSAMADATKVPAMGEFSQRHKVWVGGIYPNHCIKEKDYDQHEFVQTTMASEIKVGMLTVQNCTDGISPFKLIAARPQSTNEVADDYNSSLLHAVDDIENVHCVSMAFDGLAAETNFIRNHLISFMNGNSNTVVMTDCNHAAKNIRSQLVLGSDIVTGGKAFFDVGILRLAGVSVDLYRVNDYDSDVLVLKLCSSDTINKLMDLVVTSKEDPLNIAFMAITLYFLRTFLCAYNGEDITSEGRVTMIWSAVMWFSSLEGVSKISKNNLVTSCLGGMFLAVQKQVKNLRFTTTEPLEHTFGTVRSWRREFTINEFITYSNKLNIILKNVMEHGIATATSNKGYMHGFKGFTNVVSKIRDKLKKENLNISNDTWAVDVDYKGSPIIEQIQDNIIASIRRINGPMINIMKVFDMKNLSMYCTDVSSIEDICNIYQSSSKRNVELPISASDHSRNRRVETEEIIQRLSNLALDFNDGNGTQIASIEDTLDAKKIVVKKLSEEDGTWIGFDCQIFYSFISQNVSNTNVGNLLKHMQDSISNTMEKKRVDGSTTELQKVQSLKGRWFKVKAENVEKYHQGDNISRDDIYMINDDCYRVLSVFKKSYNKWRLERSGSKKEKLKVHLQLLDDFLGWYTVHPTDKYICVNSNDLGQFLGHPFAVNKENY